MSTVVEVGPGASLSSLVDGVALLRRGRGEVESLVEGVGRVFARGGGVDWPVVLDALGAGSGAEAGGGSGGGVVDLPTYAFQRERFWLDAGRRVGDAGGLGLVDAGHGLLGARVELAGGAGWLFTGRVGRDSHPWLVDHAVAGAVVLPGTAFLELALVAGEQLGLAEVRELTLETPLALPDHTPTTLQVTVAESDETGLCAVGVYSQQDDGAEWVRHATGSLAPAGEDTRPAPATADAVWPPAGSVPIPVDEAYAWLADRGYEYGPAFQGLRAAWRLGTEVLAEVQPPHPPADTDRFVIHPALFDAALHPLALDQVDGVSAPSGRVVLPFSWSGVRVHRSGGLDELRVRLTPTAAGTVRLAVGDGSGEPVASVAALTVRDIEPARLLDGAGRHPDLFGVEWRGVGVSVGGLGGGGVEGFVVVECVVPVGLGVVEGLRVVLGGVLGGVRGVLEGGGGVVVVTRGGVGVGGVVVDPVVSGVWGLVRSVEAEFPGRVVLVDVDVDEGVVVGDGLGALGGLVSWAVGVGEWQVVVRGGEVLVPRLVRVGSVSGGSGGSVSGGSGSGVSFGSGWVLVSGGTGGLGGVVARRLVEGFGVRRLVL
ncbi:polyketide synthase dehydratase domain-containing protein, partial [Streptomyces tsukubensis]|uniref:polyketide synthase dehydratase domain-containing protein n=1 Tax=Streptomyces tsukubensis TaxID=83656 RepID=UPI00344E9E96